MSILRNFPVGLVLLSVTAFAEVTSTEEFRYPLNEDGRISLRNVSGSIRITGGLGNEVVIVATRRADRQEYLDGLEIRIDADPDAIRIETRHPDKGGLFWGSRRSGGSVSYEMSVPNSVRLDSIETVNGDITVAAVGGAIRAKTVNGALMLEDLAGDVALETVNGSISAAFSAVGSAQRISADTVNGRIELQLPADASARISADTVNGALDAGDFGLRAEKGFIGRNLDAEIGSGDARIQLSTVNGAIRIRKI